MSDGKLISIIVPIYKVEEYLDQCIASVCDQTYPYLEIILVDDGSPDHCPALCDQWAKKDSRIKVIHKKNGGLSDARNAGLAIATGDWIAFVDSDDWLDPSYYEVLLHVMDKHKCDIVVGGFRYINTRQSCPNMHVSREPIVLNSHKALSELIRDGAVQQVVWNKLYKKSVISGISFAVGKYHEDEFWSYQVIGRANRIGIVDYAGYYYYQRPDSIMGEAFSIKRLDAIEAKCQRQGYLACHYPLLVHQGLSSLHFECMYFAQQALRTLPREKATQILNTLKNVMIQYPIMPDTLKSKKMSHKFWLLLANKSLITACVLRNVLQIGL